MAGLPWPTYLGAIYPIQRYGVVIFFILSGFLITYHCLQRADHYSFSEYLTDRFCRIFVAFVPALIFVAAVDLLFTSRYTTPTGVSAETFLANLAMLHHTPFDRYFDWLPRFEPYGSGRTFWTVAVEWWLYVMFGILFFFGRMNWQEKAASAALIVPAFLVVLYFSAWESIALSWMGGAAVAIAFVSLPETIRLENFARPFAIFLLALMAYRMSRLSLARGMNFLDLQFMLMSVGLFACSLALVNGRRAADFLARTSRFWWGLAAVSYSLYLIHHTILRAYGAAAGFSTWFDVAVFCAISFAVAIVFTWAFDRHHKMAARWLKSLRAQPVPA